MSSGPSDRLVLEDLCQPLYTCLDTEPQQLIKWLQIKPASAILTRTLQDFEVGYVVSSEGPEIRLKVIYPYLMSVLECGSKKILSELLDSLPIRFVEKPTESGEFTLGIDAAQLAADENVRKLCATHLASLRNYILVGPLRERLLWLRGTVEKADEAHKNAVPGNGQNAAREAVGVIPQTLPFQVRHLEQCWLVCKADRVLVIMTINLEDEVDVALGRAFCQEFAEANRGAMDASKRMSLRSGERVPPPCSFNEPKEKPVDLRDLPDHEPPTVGYLTLMITDQMVRGATDKRLVALAKPIMTWRNFFHFHLKHAKSFLHSRLRQRLGEWEKDLSAARRPKKEGAQVIRRLYTDKKQHLGTGKEFTPNPRSSAVADEHMLPQAPGR
mmetsp:Transcript_74958/g.163631  ORF Transcript_74958/g.163631 Transcript_74958/m.163631 type:complete len:385 (+) Transcript_74958:245-1399(+)